MTAPGARLTEAGTAAREHPGAEPDAAHPRRRDRAGVVETLALALLPVAWLWSTISVLGQAWLLPVLVAVGSMALAAALARSVGALLGTLAAALVGVAWVTAMTADDTAVLGIVPTPESLGATLAALNRGIVDIAWAVSTPIDATGAVLAAVVTAAIALALLVDVLGHALRVPALAIIAAAAPLVLPIAFRIDVPWWHALPGVIAAALVLVAPAIDERVAAGRGWVAPLALVAVAAVLSAAVPLLAPSPRETAVDLPTIEELFTPATPVLDADIDLGDQLRRPADRPVFSYSTTDGEPTVTRLMTLPLAGEDGFEATAPETGSPEVLVEGADRGAGMQMTVRMADVRALSLPTPERVSGVRAPAGSSWDQANDALRISADVETDGLEYTALGSRSPGLDAIAETSGSSGHDPYLAMPEAASAIAAQGAALVDPDMTAMQRVNAVHDYMTDGLWNYSEQLDLPGFAGASGDGWAALEGFLETRSGYCVHYASASAGLLRGAGVPARVVVGFLPGSPIAGGWAVSTNEMHAWAEAWIDGAGWVRVETTPGAGTGTASPEGAQVTQSPEPEPTETPEPAETPSPTETAAPSDSPSATPAAPTPSGGAAPGGDAGVVLDPALVRAVLTVLGVILLLLLPAIVRAAQRAQRLRRGPPGGWLELRATLADLGTRLPASATPGELQATIATRVPADAERAADRVRLAAERAVFDAGARERGAVDDDVRAVRRALAAAAPWWRRLLAAALPPSLLGVVAPQDR
ncbi:transglutaminase-like domain-containing protein [Agrococcus sp. ProA11]|uniref:transglutaminase-like domain-containing protein n=1 Tax=Agrococcus chionoecetis TaxID=3153752 RepID=UPI0032602F0F